MQVTESHHSWRDHGRNVTFWAAMEMVFVRPLLVLGGVVLRTAAPAGVAVEAAVVGVGGPPEEDGHTQHRGT